MSFSTSKQRVPSVTSSYLFTDKTLMNHPVFISNWEWAGMYLWYFFCGCIPAQPDSPVLTKTQRVVLEFFCTHNLDTASAAARCLVESQKIPESTFWFSLRRLKKLGLLEFGQSLPVRLTRFGEHTVLLQHFQSEKGGDSQERVKLE